MLVISLIGGRGKKDEKLKYKTTFAYIIAGLLIYFLSFLLLSVEAATTTIAIVYIGLTSVGYILMLTGGTLLSRVITMQFNNKDIFNNENKTLPQEERLLDNEYSINLPSRYHFKGKTRKSWINIINPFRGILVLGSHGSGKSYFVIRHVITQHIQKGLTMFIYDFKYVDLSIIAYNTWLKYKDNYEVTPQFYLINFDDLASRHRCNPLDHATMNDITDAAESAKTILMGLNREWIKRQAISL